MKLEFNKKKVISTALIFLIGFIIISNINFNQEKIKLPGLYISEQETEKGKIITVSAPDELNYENVLGYTELSKEVSKEKIHFYRLVNGEKQEIEIEKYDKNNNGLIDYIEWNVPHLSEQTYELIIEISKAEHLDSNRNLISDIYDEVKEQDNIWSELINDKEYIRITFEKKLTAKNDITIYPRIIEGNPKIKVYEVDGDELIAEFTSINSNQYNKVYLTNLISESQDIFDLKIVGGTIELDHIIDPTQLFFEDWEAGNFNNWDNSVWEIVTDRAYGGSGNSTKCPEDYSTCEMNLTASADTSSAATINVSFWYNDDDCDGAPAPDAIWYWKNSTGSWNNIGDIDAGTLACSLGDDNWCFHSAVSSEAQYKHAGFAVRFWVGVDNNENYWVDNINVSITAADDDVPIFSNYKDNNASLEDEGTAWFNVTVESTNGTVLLEIDDGGGSKNNYTAINLTANVYNVSVSMTSGGTYDYVWHSWGNGSQHNYNISNTQYYTVNSSSSCNVGSGNWEITCSDNCIWTDDFTVPANITITGSGTLTWNANMTMNATVPWEIYKEDGCEMVINPGGSIR